MRGNPPDASFKLLDPVLAPPRNAGPGSTVANGCGFTVTPGDGEALTERILVLAGDRELCVSLGARARMAFEHQWDKEKALAAWETLLQAVGHPHLG